ncbi:MAG TPA: DUF4832 domain-containing protein, partial [Patescibacteria group bacterium]|nr:DUF4832 domain-containing protein [Patescibacteria group bacterium]
RWHWTALGWVSIYNPTNAEAGRGAARIQQVFGYRFVIDEARYSVEVKPGGKLSVSFKVSNQGSAPIYYNWPVEVSLLNPATREPIWKAVFSKVDIRSWLPGDFSDKGKGTLVGDNESSGFQWDTGLEYDIPPVRQRVDEKFSLPKGLPAGNYIVALAILDPAGELPCLKFAIVNYFKGGRHPLGIVRVGSQGANADLDPASFDDPGKDNSLHYVVPQPSE